MTNFKAIFCRDCGAEIFFIRTPAGAQMPVNKKQVAYVPGGNSRVVTVTGEVVAGTITDRTGPDTEIGFTPHWASCSSADRKRNTAPVPKKKIVLEESLF